MTFIVFAIIVPLLLFIISSIIKKKTFGNMENKMNSLIDKIGVGSKLNTADTSLAKQADKTMKAMSHAMVNTIKATVTAIRGIALLMTTVTSIGTLCIAMLVVVVVSSVGGSVMAVYMLMQDEDSPLSSKTEITSNSTVVSDTADTEINLSIDDIVWVGDSRTVGMAVALGYSDDTSNGGVNIYTDKFIAETGAALGFIQSNQKGFPLVSNLTNKIIVFNLGVNDLSSKTQFYSWYLSGFADEFYENNILVFMSVNPVTNAKNKYASNEGIEQFNENLKDIVAALIEQKGALAIYVDTYTYLKDEVNTSKRDFDVKLTQSEDGLHYIPEIYLKIYEYAVNDISRQLSEIASEYNIDITEDDVTSVIEDTTDNSETTDTAEQSQDNGSSVDAGTATKLTITVIAETFKANIKKKLSGG